MRARYPGAELERSQSHSASKKADGASAASKPILRCAIYTGVSSDSGLEQDFNSLDAQREAAEAYVKSQAPEGWKLVREAFDDGGFSGGSTNRPALQKLLERIRGRRIDVVVVYKVDRLTRSLADFAKLVELFDAHKVSFVSVTQAFNTMNSMGRLTLNVLLSFAQFEREVTGERIRDKIAASKKKGLSMGGRVPLGCRAEDRKPLIVEEEAAIVRLIFDLYLQHQSIPAVQTDLGSQGVRTRVRRLASGEESGGGDFTNGPISHILTNRHYLGEINHKGRSWPGEHEPLMSSPPAVNGARPTSSPPARSSWAGSSMIQARASRQPIPARRASGIATIRPDHGCRGNEGKAVRRSNACRPGPSRRWSWSSFRPRSTTASKRRTEISSRRCWKKSSCIATPSS